MPTAGLEDTLGALFLIQIQCACSVLFAILRRRAKLTITKEPPQIRLTTQKMAPVVFNVTSGAIFSKQINADVTTWRLIRSAILALICAPTQ